MKILSALIQEQLEEGIVSLKNKRGTLKSSIQDSTIFQVDRFPIVLDVNAYKDAFSSSNPEGSYKAAYRLSKLIDNIPEEGKEYKHTSYSVESVWESIVYGANGTTGSTKELISKCKVDLLSSQKVNMDGTTYKWLNIDTIPENWCDLLDNNENLKTIDISPKDNFDCNEEIPLRKISADLLKVTNQEWSENTRIHKITADALRVDIKRPWLNILLLNRSDWSIKGINGGYYSSGSSVVNNGIMPLIIQSMFIAKNINIIGQFSEEDKTMLYNEEKEDNTIGIGPFIMKDNKQKYRIKEGTNGKTIISTPITQIIAYDSQRVPRAPVF
jgi:hypothetical protein